MEIDPNDLVAVSTRAEEVGLRVVGWYHSHPHITVHPRSVGQVWCGLVGSGEGW